MTRSYITGIDWSGDPGDRVQEGASSYLVFVATHFPADAITDLDQVIVDLKTRLRFNPKYSFKYFKSKPEHRRQFFFALERLEFQATVLVFKKESDEYVFSSGDGNHTIARCVTELLLKSPSEFVSGQKLRIDLKKSEPKVLDIVRRAVKLGLAANGREPYQSLMPIPDHRLDGSVVQVADMLAGWVKQDLSGTAERLPRSFDSRIRQS